MNALASCLALALAAATVAATAAPTCRAQSGSRAPAVVELYTSEGCSSCPPADRWLSALGGGGDVIALAFHVDYWDNLGWKDRFAQPAFTQRQAASQRTSGARFSYTPQVIVDGVDTPRWSALAAPGLAARPARAAGAAPLPALVLERTGDELVLTATPAPGAPARPAGYVAVVDDHLQSRPGAGENRGATLRHDDVVRELLPWRAAADGAQTFRLRSTSVPEAGASRHWVAVATDEAGRPLQAVSLACAP